jgi:DNA modification methylase
MKPVALVERHITNSSRRGEIVLDPFAGSGTTLIAADRLGRRAALVEFDERYADVILTRWKEWKGLEPVLDGKPMSAVAKARRKRGA